MKYITIAMLVFAATACGDESTSKSSSSITCCINGAFYDCDSSEDQADCANACNRDSSKDDECQ